MLLFKKKQQNSKETQHLLNLHQVVIQAQEAIKALIGMDGKFLRKVMKDILRVVMQVFVNHQVKMRMGIKLFTQRT